MVMIFSSPRALLALIAYAADALAVPAVSDVTLDPSAAYDLTRSGAGDSSIMPPNPLPYIDTGGTPKDFHANVEDIANTKVSRDLAAFRPEHEPEFHNCGRDRPNKVIRAIDISRTYVVKAIRYLRTQGPKPEYIHWFGEPDADRASDVEKVFVNIRNNNPMGYTYDCDCNNENLYTWVDPREFGRIYLCPRFWNIPPGGGFSQAIMIFRAASRFRENGGIQSTDLGWSAAEDLAWYDPASAIRNADNYMEFIADVAVPPAPVP